MTPYLIRATGPAKRTVRLRPSDGRSGAILGYLTRGYDGLWTAFSADWRMLPGVFGSDNGAATALYAATERTVTLRGGEQITAYWSPALSRWVTIPGDDD